MTIEGEGDGPTGGAEAQQDAILQSRVATALEAEEAVEDAKEAAMFEVSPPTGSPCLNNYDPRVFLTHCKMTCTIPCASHTHTHKL